MLLTVRPSFGQSKEKTLDLGDSQDSLTGFMGHAPKGAATPALMPAFQRMLIGGYCLR